MLAPPACRQRRHQSRDRCNRRMAGEEVRGRSQRTVKLEHERADGPSGDGARYPTTAPSIDEPDRSHDGARRKQAGRDTAKNSGPELITDAALRHGEELV